MSSAFSWDRTERHISCYTLHKSLMYPAAWVLAWHEGSAGPCFVENMSLALKVQLIRAIIVFFLSGRCVPRALKHAQRAKSRRKRRIGKGEENVSALNESEEKRAVPFHKKLFFRMLYISYSVNFNFNSTSIGLHLSSKRNF